MSARRVAAVLVISAAALLGSSGIASASGDIRVPGARLTFDSATVRLWDTADDGNPVSADVRFEGRVLKMWNDSGPGSVAIAQFPSSSGREIAYKVCVDNFGWDTCSPWKEDRT